MIDRDEIEVVVPDQEGWDSETEQFCSIKGQKIRMKHSLLSISKWEMKWQKPFLQYGYRMSEEETIDYYRCMTITQNVDPKIYNFIPAEERERIRKYIENPMSAYSPKKDKRASRAVIVSEKIYYWMASKNIPSSYEKWHLSRLLNLLDIAARDNSSDDKMGTAELFRRNHNLNMARRKALKSRG